MTSSRFDKEKEYLKKSIDRILLKSWDIKEKIEKIINAAEEVVDKNYSEFNLKVIDCSEGCGYCCILNIATLEPEVGRIIYFINRNFSDFEKIDLKKRIVEAYNSIFGLTDDERIFLRKKCIFLDENLSCKIYPVRPIMCRAITSTDRNRCIESISQASLGENLTILSNIYIKEIYFAAFNKIADFLMKNNMDNRSADIVVWLKNKMDRIDGYDKL